MASVGNRIPLSKDLLFVEKWIYDYGIPFEQSICAYWSVSMMNAATLV